MRMLVLGAGAIGGYFGGRLAEAGADVTFLVRDARAARLRTEGLVIKSPLGDVRMPVQTVTRNTLTGTYDLLLLSCKAYDLDDAIEAIRPAVTGETSIMPLLNGLAHLERLDAAFGAAHVLGGLARISTTLEPDGTIRHLSKPHSIVYGARSEAQQARCATIEAHIPKTAFDATRSDAIMLEMWEKFTFITAAAGITCLMRANMGAILQGEDGERLTLRLLGECEAVAAAAGFTVRPQAQSWGRGWLTERGSSFTTSMLRDVQSGAKIEADHLQGDMIKRGDALGVDVPLLRVAYCHLQAYQSSRAAR